jgi:hypothetical protein
MASEQTIDDLQKRVAELEMQNRKLKTSAKKDSGLDWRSFWSWALIVVGFVTLVPAAILIWLNHVLFNQQTYLETVGPVIKQPAVQHAITVQASDKLFSSVNVDQALSQALPDQAQFLIPAISAQVKTQTTNTIAGVVGSDKFYQIWINTNRRAQERFVQVATTGQGDPTVDVNDVYKYVSSQLQDTRLAPLLNKTLPPRIGIIQLAYVPALAQIPHWVAQFNVWRWALIILSLALSILAVAIAKRRSRAVAGVGWAWIAAVVVTLIGGRIARNMTLAAIPGSVNRDAAAAIWTTVLNFFYQQLAVMFVFGLVLVIFGWLIGQGVQAVRFRTGAEFQLAKMRAQIIHDPEHNEAIAFLQRYRRYFEVGLIILAIIVMLLLTPLTVGLLLTVLAWTVVFLVILEMFAAPNVLPETEKPVVAK